MAIFRGTGGSGSSSDSTIVDAVTAQAGIANTKAGEAEGFRDEAEGFKNTASSAATTATNKAGEANTSATTANTKATEANTAKTGAETAQTAAEAARDAALGHSNTANSSAVQTVAGSNTQVVGVYNNIANVNTVAGVNTDVTTVAGISSDVTTVAADASDIGTVSTNITNVNNVGNNIANVNAVHSNASNINTVVPKIGAIEIVALKQAQVQTVSDNINDVTTVAGLESKMDTVIADASDIGAVAGNIGDVSTVANINSDVDTVAGIAAKVTTVADNISDVQNADTNATNAASSASNASASATSASNSATTATTKATEASNSATAASNSAITATAKASQAAGSATAAGTSASTATTKASEASASATTATTKAGEAASSASAASGDATTATTKASEADASATSAATSATNSSNAASTWNNFYNSYLGTSDAPPSVDVLGNAIVAGALYYDTGAGSNAVGLYVYNGSSWVYSTNYNNVTAPYILAQDLNANGNDIISVGNLGIGGTPPADANLFIGSAQGNSQALMFAGYGSDKDGAIKHTNGVISFLNGGNNTTVANLTERMRIDSSGNVGIGTSSPAQKLHIDGIALFENNKEIRFKDSGGTQRTAVALDSSNDLNIGTSAGGNLKFINGSSYTERMRIDSSGNVRIGTVLPQTSAKFNLRRNGTNIEFGHGNRTSGYYGTLGAQSTNGQPYMGFSCDADDSGNTFTTRGFKGNALIGTTTGDLTFNQITSASASGQTPSERMRIDSSGNVGIGTTNPLNKLHVDGEAGIEIYNASGGGDALNFRPSLGSSNKYNLSITSYDHSGGGVGPADGLSINGYDGVSISTGSSTGRIERLRVAQNGDISFYEDTGTTPKFNWDASTERLGIGTTSPQDALHINSDTTDARLLLDGHTNFDAELKFAENGSVKYTVGHDAATDSFRIGTANVDTNPRLVIDSSGNVLVGKTSTGTDNGVQIEPAGAISLNRDSSTPLFLNRKTSDGNIVLFRKDGTTVGSISVTSSVTAYNTSSDERLKENIQDADDAGSKIDGIRIRQFDWKSDGSHQDYGVVAQELLEVAPEAVTEGETEDDMMAVDYSKLVPTLIKEIQTLRNRVAQLENN